MDRMIVYPGQVPLETDLLNTNKQAMVGIAKLAAALFGTSTFANGFGAGQTTVPSLQFVVQPGEVYSLVNMDGTAYSSLIADTVRQVLKQGVLLDAATLTTVAPVTAGQSINYLVQVAFAETDLNAVALPYYNPSNPAVAWTGPANSGTPQPTTRADQAVVTLKAGAAATTGSQITPAPDSGNVGLWVVTVANGQSTVVASNIVQYAGAPFIPMGGAASNAHNAIYSKSVAGSTDVVLTAQEAANPIINLTGVLTASINLIVPATSHQWIINNATTGAFTVTVKTASGTGVAAAQGSAASFYCDGVSVYLASATVTPDASTTVKGKVRLATSAEAIALTDALTAVSPSTLSAALTSILVTAASDPTFADNSTKTASTGWVRGAMLAIATAAGFASSFATNGYVKFPSWLGGLILQWGTLGASGGGYGTASATFPIAFPTAVYTVNSNPSSTGSQVFTDMITAMSTTGFTVYGANYNHLWFAIGK